MSYLEEKKRAFLSIVNRVKGFVRTISGTPPITLPDCVSEDSIVNYTLSGEGYQDGTPTPEEQIEVEFVGDLVTDTTDVNYGKYKIPVKASGKNKFNINKIENGTGFVVEDNAIIITKEAGNYAYVRAGITPEMFLEMTGLKEGDQIITALTREVTNGTPANTTGRMQFTGKNGFATYNLTNSGEAKLTTVPENFNSDNYSALIIYGCSNGEAGDVITKLSNIIIAKQETYDGKYEPYVEPITTNIYLDEPLSKFDHIDFENQKLVRNLYARTLNQVWGGTGAAPGTITNTYPFYIRYTGMKASYSNDIIQILATGLKGVTYNHFYNTDEECICVHNNSVELRLNKEKIGGNTQALATTYLKEHPMTIYYALDTPTETDIVLPKLPTFKGTTVYSVDTKINPSNMSVTYYSSVKGE